jgi:hypothetical protein
MRLTADILYRLGPQKTIRIDLISLKAVQTLPSCPVMPPPQSLASSPVAVATASCSTVNDAGSKETGPEEAVLHRIVLFLGKLHQKASTWDELLAAVTTKHPGVSKKLLRTIVHKHRTLFSVMDGRICLCKLNAGLVKKYFELAQVEKVAADMSAGAQNHQSEACRFTFSNTIVVSGIFCTSFVSRVFRAVIFPFGDASYTLVNTLPGPSYLHGQTLRAVLRLRKDGNKNNKNCDFLEYHACGCLDIYTGGEKLLMKIKARRICK